MSTGITLALCLQVPTLALGLQVSTPSVAIYRKLERDTCRPSVSVIPVDLVLV
jgi:hypothetical protein